MKLPEGIIRLQKLRKGEEVICKTCGLGIYKPVGTDCKHAHGFVCSECGAKINID